MAFEASYESLDDIPEAMHEHFVEVDGKYIPQVKGLDKTQEDVRKLRESLTKERNDHKSSKERYSWVTEFGELDDVRSMLEGYEELKIKAESANGKVSDEDIDKMVEGRLGAKVKPLEQRLGETDTKLQEALAEIQVYQQRETTRDLHATIRKAAEKAKVIPEAIEDAILLAERVFEKTDVQGWVTKDIGDALGGDTAESWIVKLQETRPHWFPVNEGGGSRGGKGEVSGNNPFKTGNMTEQMLAYKNNPELAKRQAKAAGKTIPGVG